MKQFLIDQFTQFSDQQITDFVLSVTGRVPTFTTVEPSDEMVNCWGYEGDGYWTMNAREASFFEDDGTFHLLGTIRDAEYFKIFSDLYNAGLTSDICKFAEPLLCEAVTVTEVHHLHPARLRVGDTMWYMKFKAPSYGRHIYQEMLLTTDFDFETFAMKYIIDANAWVLSTLKELGHLCPQNLDIRHLMKNDAGYFFLKMEPFLVSVKESAEFNLKELDCGTSPDRLNLEYNSRNRIMEYARYKWLTLLT